MKTETAVEKGKTAGAGVSPRADKSADAPSSVDAPERRDVKPSPPEKEKSAAATPSKTAPERPDAAPSRTARAKTADQEKTGKKDGRGKSRYTTGEKIYDQVNFWAIKGLILVATAALAYFAKFGKPVQFKEGLSFGQKWGVAWQEWKAGGLYRKIEIPLANMQQFFIDRVRTPGFKHAKKVGEWIAGREIGENFVPNGAKEWIGYKTKEIIGVFGAAFASTMVLFHGGNVVSPVVRSFENHRKELVEKWNKKWGKKGDVEIANEKFKDLPKQNWGDVIKGRLGAWLTVFLSFVTAFIAIGTIKKGPNKGMYRFSAYEEWFARACTGLNWGKARLWVKSPFKFMGTTGKDLPLIKEIFELEKSHPLELAKSGIGKIQKVLYKCTHVIAMDFYATSMGIIVWNFFSRRSAKKRQKHEMAHEPNTATRQHTTESTSSEETLSEEPLQSNEEKPSKPFSTRMPEPAATHAASERGRDLSAAQLAAG